MKWVIASVGLLVVIVVFSLAALDQKDVVWADGVPHCPHCRNEVPRFAEVCPRCQRAFDWQSYESECGACFADLDAKFFRKVYEERREQVHAALRNEGANDAQVADFDLYFEALTPDACAYCGGTGKWLAPGFKDGVVGAGDKMTRYLEQYMEGACPVCFGDGRCALCDGERRVLSGREDADRALRRVKDRLSRLNTPFDEESARERFREIQSYIRRYAGREGILSLPSFDLPATGHMDRAVRRLRFLRTVLNGLVE
jgi:hypothetical protein